MSIQDFFLNQLRKERCSVTLQTLDKENIVGVIKGFDNFSILLQCEKSLLLIYKHALKAILPPKDFAFKPPVEKESGKKF